MPVSLLVSCSGSRFSEIFAVGSLLAAVTVGFLAVVRDVPSRPSLSAAALLVAAFVVWICHAATPASGNYQFMLSNYTATNNNNDIYKQRSLK